MIQDLQLAGLGERTQEAYVRAVRKLAAHYRQSPDRFSEAQVRDYFLYLKNDCKFSPSALKIAHSGITFFYTRTVVRDWATLLQLRVPRHKSLPDVLTVDEVHRILAAVRTCITSCPVERSARRATPGGLPAPPSSCRCAPCRSCSAPSSATPSAVRDCLTRPTQRSGAATGS